MTLHHASLENEGSLQDFGFNGEPHERQRRVPEVLGAAVSFCRIRVLAVVLGRLHLEDVRNDAVNRDVTYQASEEELLCDARVHEAQGWETSQDTGQPGETNRQQILQSHLDISCLLCLFI